MAKVMEEESLDEEFGAKVGTKDEKNTAASLPGDVSSRFMMDGVCMTSVEMFVPLNVSLDKMFMPQKEWEAAAGNDDLGN